MSRKFSLIVITTLLTSSTSWAYGFYIGAGLGPQTADFRQSANIVQPGSFNVKDSTHLSGAGIFGSIFGGYGWNMQACYLAAEFNADASSVEFKSSNKEFIHQSFSHTTYKIPYDFGVSLLPGYLLTGATLFYARLGYTYGHFEISTTDSSIANISKNLNGFRFGFGLKQALSQQLGTRIECSQVMYQSTQFSVVDGITTKTTKISPNTSQVEFSLIYDFC